MKLIECRACGSKELIEGNGVTTCVYCQARYMPESASQVPPAVVETAKTEFDVILESTSNKNKIPVIKTLRELTGYGLAEAKKFVESTPRVVVSGVSESVAYRMKTQLEAAGGIVSIK